MIIKPGTTSLSVDVMLADDEGLPLSGLLAAAWPPVIASPAFGADVPVTLVNLGSVSSPWASGGVISRGGGVYRLDLPNSIGAAANVWTLRGEAAGKHLIANPVQVVDLAVGGDGDYPVDHDHGGVDALAYYYGAAPVQNGRITIYAANGYAGAGRPAIDQVFTDSLGRWQRPSLLLRGGSYVLLFDKPGVYAATRVDLTLPE
jgi:hypothetical protein